MYDLVIENGKIIDGSGADSYVGDIGIKNKKIEKIGRIPEKGRGETINASGKYVTPGFIDMHSHVDCTVPFYPEMESYLGQGITTCFAGHCGMGVAPITDYYMEMILEEQAFTKVVPQTPGGLKPAEGRIVKTNLLVPHFKKVFGIDLDWRSFGEYLDHLEKAGVGCNLMIHIPHAQVRLQAMGLDYKRTATKEEIRKMQKIVEDGLAAGANGLSFGLDYPTGIWADGKELLALARSLKPSGAQLTAHVQLKQFRMGVENKKHSPLDGMKEIMDISLKAGVPFHISHIQNGYKILPEDDAIMADGARRTLQEVYKYREKGLNVTWDVLPHDVLANFYFPHLAYMLKPYVDDCGGMHAFSRALKTGDYRQEIAEPIKKGQHRSVGIFSTFNPVEKPEWAKQVTILKCTNKKYVEKNLEEIAKKTKKDPVDVILDILEEDPVACCSRIFARNKAVADTFIDDEEASIGLDNGAYNYGYKVQIGDLPVELGTPTSFSGIITYLERKNRPRFEDMIKRLTGNAAKAAQIKDRGFIKEGYMADLVVIDYDHLKSNFNLIEPQTAPDGIDYVIVNGEIAVRGKKHLHPKNGMILRRL
jgi:N-acyl-D-aspartate/D-glutamate deacylase